MTGLGRYPEYKPSGVEWLGPIPSDWGVRRIKGMAGLITTKAPERDFAVALENIEGWTGAFLDSEAELSGEGVAFRRGDVLFGKLRPYLAKVWLADRSGEAVGDFHVLRPDAAADARFLQYLMLTREFISLVNGSTYGAKMPRASWDFVGGVAWCLPSRPEQHAIADFLDRETSEIDAFIADQDELVAVLQERRAAVVTRAVTKGLDPLSPMEDSGVEWVGSIPEGWQARRLSHIFGSVSSGTTPPTDEPDYYGGETNWVTTGELRESIITETSKAVTELALDRFSALKVYPTGTLLIAMYGATIGRLGILGRPATTNQACCAFANPRGVDSKFVFYSLLAAREHLLVLASGGGQPNINQDKLRSLRIPVPDIATQSQIVEYLDRETAEIDAAIADAKEAIEVSKERRAALISAAVTGKIDVRNHVATMGV